MDLHAIVRGEIALVSHIAACPGPSRLLLSTGIARNMSSYPSLIAAVLSIVVRIP